MSARNIVGGLAGAAVSVARKPLETTVHAVNLAKGVVSTGAAAAEGLAQHAAGRVRRHQAAPVEQRPSEQDAQDAQDDASGEDAVIAGREPEAGPEPEDVVTPVQTRDTPAQAKKATKKPAATKPAATKPAAAKPVAKKPAATKKPVAKTPAAAKLTPQAQARSADDGPQVVLREPAPPAEPPVDIVGQVLAAEGEEESREGRVTEPRGASREEEHGEAALQRAEVDEIAEETAEALPGGDVDVQTPVGTTGAGVAFNPDTAEADLQQPQTQPLVDPALTKQVKAAQRTGTKGGTKPPKS